AAEQASRVGIIPALKRKIAIIAATESRMAHGSKVPITGTSNEKPKPRKCHAARNQVWSANQIARLRMTPTTAAVMPASAPLRGLLSRNFSINGAPSPIHRKHGTKVHQDANSPPHTPASIGGKAPGSRYAARKPTNW